MSFASDKEKELQGKVIPQTKQPDFEEFWMDAVAEMRKVPLQIKRKKMNTPYSGMVTTWEISYNTHDDTWIDAYFSYPTAKEGQKMPCVAWFHGGSLEKGLHLDVVNTGVACFSADVRGQGGTSIDRAVYHSGDINGALMTRGVLDKNEFYMKHIFLDAVRQMDVIASLPEVDPERIVTYGGSQGGGLSVVASGLSGHSKKAYVSEPSFCCIKQRIILGSRIFGSTNGFLKKYPGYTDQVFETVSYFDVNNMVSFLKVPSMFVIGLADDVCLPHFVYSAYHHAGGDKQLYVYPFQPHTEIKDSKNLIHEEFTKL
ncbi:MAG: acetylxylan esterase [Oscillospiraceae bacterium]|nr:acetylxylan esterase [Oscillospiraceae bacterium]